MTALKVPSLVLSTLFLERGFSIFLYKGNGIESLNHTASGRGGNVRSIGMSWNTRLDIDTYILNKIEMIDPHILRNTGKLFNLLKLIGDFVPHIYTVLILVRELEYETRDMVEGHD